MHMLMKSIDWLTATLSRELHIKFEAVIYDWRPFVSWIKEEILKILLFLSYVTEPNYWTIIQTYKKNVNIMNVEYELFRLDVLQ